MQQYQQCCDDSSVSYSSFTLIAVVTSVDASMDDADFPVLDSTDAVAISVRCRCCEAVLTTHAGIGMLKPLPTGLLDNVSGDVL